MRANRNTWILVVSLLMAAGSAQAVEPNQGTVPDHGTTPGAAVGFDGQLVRNLMVFPAGDYEMVRSVRNQTTQLVNRQQTQASDTTETFHFDMKYTPPSEGPGAVPGRMAVVVRRIQVKLGDGGEMSYDSAASPAGQSPTLAKLFGHLIGAKTAAGFQGKGALVRPFMGLDAQWANSGPSGAAGRWGDIMLNEMLNAGAEYVNLPPFMLRPTDVTSQRLGAATAETGTGSRIQLGGTWKVTKQRPGLRHKFVDVEHACRVGGIEAGQPVITVTWKINAMKPEIEGARMTTYGVDEKGSAEVTVSSLGGIVTKFTRVVKRTDQQATRAPDGRITQQTTTTTRTASFSIRKKDTPPAPSAPKDVAKAILTAYKAKDFRELMKFCAEANLPMIEAIAQQGVKHPRYGSLFKGWRWTAVEAWDGKLGEVRYPSATKAWALFYETPRRGALFVVVLVREQGNWRFEDIHSPGKTQFHEAAKTP
ncbi:MAG: hypothetical protein ISS72_08580 [Candidatus Brocadiae bacterium]|nr:hypothetical protein [Candidatus Brocadiia bacterium]